MSPGSSRPTGSPGSRLTGTAEALLLGLDVGTSTIKALLIDRAGGEARRATVATPFDRGEMTADRLVAALASVLQQLGAARHQVVAAGIAGVAESGAPLDRHGRAQAPIIAWFDGRGAEVVDRLHRHFGPDLDRSIGQRLRTVSSVAKLGWLVDNGMGPVAHWLGVPELALHALTGAVATDYSLAARTGAYHVGDRRYLPEVAEALWVPPGVFPPVAPAGRPMGAVSPAGAAWSGLPPGIPVTIAGHDHLAGRAGSGARPGDLANSVGTAETVLAGDQPWPDVDRALSLRVAVTTMPGGKTWALLASAARAGLVLSVVARALGGSAAEMDAAASASAPVPVGDGLIDAAGRGGPVELPDASPGALWRGVLEALTARTWDAVDRVGRVADGAPSALVVFGGGSRSRPWLEAKAAARPALPVWRSGAAEAVARGAALSAGVAAGWWPAPEAGPQMPLTRVLPPPAASGLPPPWPAGSS